MKLIRSALFFAVIMVCGVLQGQKKMIDKKIVVSSPVDTIWSLWTTEEGVARFFAPQSDIELKPGGKYEIFFLPGAPYGSKGSEGSQVLSFIQNEMFSFSWNAPPKFQRIRESGEKTWVVINMKSSGSGSTEVRLRHLGFGEGEEWDQVQLYFESAWEYVLNNLKAKLEE